MPMQSTRVMLQFAYYVNANRRTDRAGPTSLEMDEFAKIKRVNSVKSKVSYDPISLHRGTGAGLRDEVREEIEGVGWNVKALLI